MLSLYQFVSVAVRSTVDRIKPGILTNYSKSTSQTRHAYPPLRSVHPSLGLAIRRSTTPHGNTGKPNSACCKRYRPAAMGGLITVKYLRRNKGGNGD